MSKVIEKSFYISDNIIFLNGKFNEIVIKISFKKNIFKIMKAERVCSVDNGIGICE
jgi:hypothetical protein